MKKIFCFLLLLSACSSEPKKTTPDWITAPTRVVDNGYIVYVGSAEASNPQKAQFRAEGVALEDLANECSFIPKGARIEDRYSDKKNSESMAYVKVAVEFKDCDEAQKSLEPSAIKERANVAFTEQLKKYQDLEETGEMSDTRAGDIEPVTDVAAAPVRTEHMSEDVHFYAVRQYVAYQKEIVVLAPPTAYAPNSPETQHFTNAVTQPTSQISSYTASHPDLKTRQLTWSRVQDKPTLTRPVNLTKNVHSSFQPMKMQKPPKAARQKGREGKRRKRQQGGGHDHP